MADDNLSDIFQALTSNRRAITAPAGDEHGAAPKQPRRDDYAPYHTFE